MIVIPMVGLSSRFFREGFDLPKYQLLIGDKTVFACVINSFRRYFFTDKFLILCRNDFNTRSFVIHELTKLGVLDFEVIVFYENTLGQAHTVYKGLRNIGDDEELYIFNIDTFRFNFEKFDCFNTCHGYLEVVVENGDNWSFVLPGPNSKVLKTTEKDRISDLCSNGLYYFKRKDYFDIAFDFYYRNNIYVNGEFYIAPLYNKLIDMGLDIYFQVVNSGDVIFCGTPIEYSAILGSDMVHKISDFNFQGK